MLERILKLYSMAMACDVRSPLPHLVGPPGCGKSTVAEQAAELLGVNLHILNVSRMSPLDVEGVQMPETLEGEVMKLRMLHATFWTQLKEGDIVLLDEFLRGFPEVYNALLDILTSRRVGSLVLPRVFIMAASNSVTAYDAALEDRLMHLPVPDPRTNARNSKVLAELIVDKLGLMPKMVGSMEMQDLLTTEVYPMYELLDAFKGNGNKVASVTKGHSVRNLIGQAQLREVKSSQLAELLSVNNRQAMSERKWQFVFLTSGKGADPRYIQEAKELRDNPKLTMIQAQNLELNLQLVELEEVRNEKGIADDEDDEIFTDLV